MQVEVLVVADSVSFSADGFAELHRADLALRWYAEMGNKINASKTQLWSARAEEGVLHMGGEAGPDL